MTTLTSKFPAFEANQVLTNAHLNQLFQYLDEQNRITRSSLVGVGIACGFELNVNGTTVTVHSGCGVSSEGYLLSALSTIDYVGYKNYSLPIELDYPAFKNSVSPFAQYQLIELLAAGEPGAQPLTASILANKAVILFLELKKDNLRNCSPNNCDDKGAEVTATLRPLLISRTDLDAVIAKSSPATSTTDIENNLLARLNLPDIALPRVDVLSTDLKTSNRLIQAIRAALGANLVPNLTSALVAATDAFKPLLGNVSFAAAQAKLNTINAEINSSAKITHIQNYYDFIDDLIKAYDELRWAGLDLLCMCNPSDALFPRHLMLGLTNPASVTNPQYYRNRFLASPALTSCEEKTANLTLLFKRVLRMVESFNSQPALHTFADNVTDKQIRITPSKLGDVVLSQKAIPYYYENSAGATPLYKLWSVEKTHRNRATQNQSYRSFEHAPQAPSAVLNPLKYELEPYNFLRIEGHLNKSKQDVISTLNAYKMQYRLPIEVISVETGETKSKSPNQIYFNTLKDFLAQHPGVQHKSGVPMGGTFVVVCHGNSDNENISGGGSLTKDIVLTDFYLPYPIYAKVESGSRTVKDCEYDWIDSVKNLNNIMLREYRLVASAKAKGATEQEKQRLATNYVIRIYKYQIQGVDLLKGQGSYDVVVPLEVLKTKGLNAIAADLNAKFPTGLVFDTKDKGKKLLLRYLDGDDFRIELGGIQGHQIRYAFTNEGVSRWQHQVWESLYRHNCCKNQCKALAGPYKEDDYAWLHEAFPAIAPAVYALPTTKQVIDWSRLILRRSRLYESILSSPIADILTEILKQIHSIDDKAKVQLIGSWANGSWVSSKESDNLDSFHSLVTRNNRNTEGYKAAYNKFLQLRQKVTGKAESDFSDIDLLVESDVEITSEMLHVATVYKINIIKGKADSQKGINTRRLSRKDA